MGEHRTPPHSLSSEEALLGAALLSRNAIESVIDLITPGDFYDPSNALIYEAISHLYRHGDPVDVVTVADRLSEGGNLDQIGGPSTLIELQANTPSTTNVAKYAKNISGYSVLRKVIGVALEASDAAYQPDVDPDSVVRKAQEGFAEALSGVMGGTPDDLWVLDDFLDRPMEDRPQWVIPGMLRQGWRAMVVATEGSGKMLPLGTPLPTPTGWTTMGDVRVGDMLIDRNGNPCSVLALSQIDPTPESYELEFSDGERQVACVDHQWVTLDYKARQPGDKSFGELGVVTTGQIRDTLKARNGHCLNHAIPVAGAFDLPEAELPIDPYLLGVWLGDGSANRGTVHLADRDAEAILSRIEWPVHVVPHSVELEGKSCEYRLEGFHKVLAEEGLLGDKRIPRVYMRASFDQRLALLQGLMDTDGFVEDGGFGVGRGSGSSRCELTFTNEGLSIDALELIRTLGIIATMKESEAKIDGRYISQRWRIGFQTDLPVVTIPFKADRLAPLRTQRAKLRYIKSVKSVDPVPMRCITVDSPDSTYLCGEACIPTHNTVLLRQIGIAAAQGIHPLHFQPMEPCRVLIVDLENPDDSVVDVCAPLRSQTELTSYDYDRERVYLWHKPGGINLRSRRDRVEFESVIATAKPDLVCLGPIYKSYNVASNESDELAAKEVMACFDDLRTRYSFALLLEHHAPKGGGSKRDLSPYGTSLWLRWPELGISLTVTDPTTGTMKLGRWRGDRMENAWPIEIRRGKPWLWQGVWPSGTFNNDPGGGVLPSYDDFDTDIDLPDQNDYEWDYPDEDPLY